jgi:integrase
MHGASMAEIQSVANRLRLGQRREPHWIRLGKGQFLGYRKMTNANGQWIARSRNTDTGKQDYKALGDLENIRDADRYFEAKKLAEAWFLHMGRGGSNKTITIKDVCTAYVTYLADEKSPNSARDVERRFKQYVLDDSKFANLELEKLTEVHVRNWLRKLKNTPCLSGPQKGNPRGASSLNRDITPFRAALNFAKEMRLTSSDHPWSKVLKPTPGVDQKRQIILTNSEIAKLSSVAPLDLGNLITALSLIPLRPGAVAKLRVGDFNTSNGVLTIPSDKAGAGRSVALPPTTANFFRDQTKNKLPTAPLISRSNGKYWDKDSWKDIFKSAVNASGTEKKATIYSLRHTGITNLIESGVPTLTVAQITGTSVKMIETNYGHLTQRMSIAALEKIAHFS